MCVCVTMVWTIWPVLGAYSIFLAQWLFSFLSFLSLQGCWARSPGMAIQIGYILGSEATGQRPQGMSSTFKTKPGLYTTSKRFWPRSVPWWIDTRILTVGTQFSAYICIHTAGKLRLDVTSVLGRSLQLSKLL